MAKKIFQDTPEQIIKDIAWCEERRAKYPEYRVMYDRWIAKYQEELAEAQAS